MEKKPCFLCVVTLHMSLHTIRNKIRSLCKISGIIVQYGQLFSFRQTFVKIPISNFNEIPSIGSRADICGQTYRQTDGQTDGWKERCDEANSLLRYLCERAE